MTHQRDMGGFTLLEMIVVVGLFALVAAMAYGGLMSVLKTRDNIEQNLNRTAAFQKAYWFLRDDFQNGIDRSIRNDNGGLYGALRYTGLDREVDFTRAGWANPLRMPRSTLRRVGYWWNSDKDALIRRTWPVLDRAPRTREVDTVLLKGVDDLHWRFLASNGKWYDQWPTPEVRQRTVMQAASQGSGGNLAAALKNAPAPPIAVKMILKTDDWGQLQFLFSYGKPQSRLAGQNQQLPGSVNNIFSHEPEAGDLRP